MPLLPKSFANSEARGGWQVHAIRQGDGKGGWIARPALRQVLKHPDAIHTMPFGLVQMDNGEVALLCSREKQAPEGTWIFEPIIAFSRDGGATWSDFANIPGAKGRPQYFTYLGKGRLSFVTEVFARGEGPQRIFSDDYGRTWTERISHPPTKEGMPFGLEGNAWVDRDEEGLAKAILEVGWHYAPGKSHPRDDATAVFRRSLDGGRTWIDETAPPQWKFTVEHKGKKWLRGVSEGAIVRAANGDLVAALRSDMLPQYFDGPHDDSLEGTAISISRDDGKTWSDLNILFDAGRHHANLQRLPNGDLVCTLIVRDDIQDGQLVSHRRGCDALISKDHGKTWNLDRRCELDCFEFLREDGYWVDGRCGHIGAVALNDGYLLSVYGNYRLGAVLIKWKPDARPARRVPKVGIQIGPNAPDLERCAADELASYLDKLFHVRTKPAVAPPDFADRVLLVGTPQTNPAVAKALGKKGWPPVSDQGIVLKRVELDGKQALVIGGGSPVATLWAVYELVERWGVRYLLHGDLLPEKPRPFRLPKATVVLEPNLKIRQWRVVNDFACGPESWGIADYRPILDQLAKLKFNRILVNLWPYQPFLHLEVRGIKKERAWLWYDCHYPITDDMVGRHLFGDEPEFWNPDLPLGASYEEFAAAGERHIHALMAYARQRGMKVVVSVSPTEFPSEFAPLLPSWQKVRQLGEMWIVPGQDLEVDDPALAELAAAVLRATINTYPEADFVSLEMPEFRQWVGQYERAWRVLDGKYGLEKVCSLAEVLAHSRSRPGYPGSAERAVDEVKGDLVSLYFFDRLLTELEVLKDTRRPDVKFIFNGIAEELFPILPRLLPAGSETLNFVDYTPSRVVKRRAALRGLSPGKIPASLIFTLHDDNVGVLPQLTTGSLHELAKDLRKYGWAGFSTRYWLIGDHDPCVAYLSRASWDAAATPGAIYRDQLRAAVGTAAIADMLRVFREVEAATVQLEWHGLGLAFPVSGMMMKHWQPEPFPAPLVAVRECYARGLAAVQRARAKALPRGQKYVDYWIRRLEFGIEYLHAIEAVRNAAMAEAEKKTSDVRRHAEEALGAARRALEAYAAVAQDRSDLGALAIMNEYIYRPLKAKVAELK